MTFNDITKDAAFYTTTSRLVVWLGAFPQERQGLWLPKHVLQDSSTWSSPPLVLLRDIHNGLLAKYDCKEHSAPPQSQTGERARLGRSSQDRDSQQEEASPVLLPQLNRLNEAFVRAEDASTMPPIPSQNTGSPSR